ncbi:MAG: hypothetical protein ABFC96_14785 [Thermoguttaceae bacterium]
MAVLGAFAAQAAIGQEVGPAALGPTQPFLESGDPTPPPPLIYCEHSVEATWYTRFDYFSWNEQNGGDRLLDESGTLYTFGYQRRLGSKRFRLELFDGVVDYSGATQSGAPVESTTAYIGARGEAEWVWDFDIRPAASTSLVAGLGTRIWIRDLRDGTIVGNRTDYAEGYQETWWTIYPYVGLEKKWLLDGGEEVFLSARLGVTAVTYVMPSLVTIAKDSDGNAIGYIDPAPLFPSANMTSQIELGLRYGPLIGSAFFESMTWQESAVARGLYQPDSRMMTIGLKLGLCF